jgi:uncharacterized protein (TIGR03437 family)
MHRFVSLPVTLAIGLRLYAQSPSVPSYTAANVVNSATSTPNALAVNSIGTIYGTNLSYDTASGHPDSTVGALPEELAGVHVYLAGLTVGLYYVAPQQINFLIPPSLRAGAMDCFVAREGTAGPHVSVTVGTVAPGLFTAQPGILSGAHPDGSAITKSHPAKAGETVMLFGTGWGQTTPPAIGGQISAIPAPLADLKDFSVFINGTRLAVAGVLYAGSTPLWPGLYQVKVRLPKPITANPEIKIEIGKQSSQAGLHLPLQ